MKTYFLLFLFYTATCLCLGQEEDSIHLLNDSGLKTTSIPFSLVKKTPAERMILLNHYYNKVLRYSDSTDTFNFINKLKKLSNSHKDQDLFLEAELINVHFYH